MSGVYGSFVECFPEITRTYDMWNDKNEQWTIRSMYIPSKGESIVRKKLRSVGADVEIRTVRGAGYSLEEKPC